ncbi:hypothetical protein ACIGB6_19605 [Paeniglutamicibacter gangotriensis]|uniref:hypothetical protein n=1 Tax=Paeniglutamicibacter gangotriensis TaxID=254787 RepID=UPI0037C99306
MITNKIFHYEDFKLKYSHKIAQQDRRHLVVIFSGYRERDTYDLYGSSTDKLKCDIIWIEDWFDTNHAYYIRTKNGFGPAEAVQALIQHMLNERKLEKSECTLAGFSKGASASLYHGLKYDYSNIITAAPRMNMASANETRHPDVYENMIGPGGPKLVSATDRLIPDLLGSCRNKNKNIYLFTSKSDYQYTSEIEPFVELYKKYDNFNYVLTDSPLVKEHIDVTWYNLPLIIATLTALSEGAAPRFGMVRNGDTSRTLRGGETPGIREVRDRREAVAGFSSLRIRGTRVFPIGWAFIKGFDASTYKSLNRELILKSANHQQVVRLGGLHDPRRSAQFFENEYVDYSKVKFASLHEAGFDLKELPNGRYSVLIKIEHDKITKVLKNFDLPALGRRTLVGNSIVHLETTNGGLFLVKQPVFQPVRSSNLFYVKSQWSQDSLFHIEGYFAVHGQPASEWSDLNYYLVIRDKMSKDIIKVISIAKDDKSVINAFMDSDYLDYSKCFFTTPKYLGVNVGNVDLNECDLFISLATAGGVYTKIISPENIHLDLLNAKSFNA